MEARTCFAARLACGLVAGFLAVFPSDAAAEVLSPGKRDEAALAELQATFSADGPGGGLDASLLRQVYLGHPASVAWLIRNGADCDAATERGVSALMLAAARLPLPPDNDARREAELEGLEVIPWAHEGEVNAAAERVFDRLLDCADALDAKDTNGFAAVHYAAGRKRFDAVVRLVERGANINATDGNGATVLMAADHATLAMLIQHGADIHAKDAQGRTILHRAFRSLAPSALLHYVATAIQLGAVDIRDGQGRFASESDVSFPFSTPVASALASDALRAERHQVDQARALIRSTRP